MDDKKLDDLERVKYFLMCASRYLEQYADLELVRKTVDAALVDVDRIALRKNGE